MAARIEKRYLTKKLGRAIALLAEPHRCPFFAAREGEVRFATTQALARLKNYGIERGACKVPGSRSTR
jgi:hypothetical protein